jgi:hypothetical protein
MFGRECSDRLHVASVYLHFSINTQSNRIQLRLRISKAPLQELEI